ncbi:hypothetical protein ACN20G_28340 (plasmid) [Streptomyces sp. BI20]|uniref:hypothetical protein n=1 Tax=Streptomyces sp. BI20 TaxID=3403460 RepID=UPI003C71163D
MQSRQATTPPLATGAALVLPALAGALTERFVGGSWWLPAGAVIGACLAGRRAARAGDPWSAVPFPPLAVAGIVVCVGLIADGAPDGPAVIGWATDSFPAGCLGILAALLTAAAHTLRPGAGGRRRRSGSRRRKAALDA